MYVYGARYGIPDESCVNYVAINQVHFAHWPLASVGAALVANACPVDSELEQLLKAEPLEPCIPHCVLI